MSDKTGIQWTEATWNPVTGCSKVSQGCKNCYALRDWARLAAPRPKPNIYTGREFTDVRFHPERLDQPLRWRRPRRVFVNSMSDLFHEKVPPEVICAVFGVMALTPRHTYQVLTKRPERMFRWLTAAQSTPFIYNRDHPGFDQIARQFPNGYPETSWPLPNVWLGVSVEDQATADERIPLLLQTPAAVRFVSYEPALRPVDFAPHLACKGCGTRYRKDLSPRAIDCCPDGTDMLDWVIVGGESGPGARPCDVAWIRSAVEQCKAAGVPCFVKQLGARPRGWCAARLMIDECDYEDGMCDFHEAHEGMHCGDRCAALDDRKGGDPAEWPADLRVREMPR